MTMIPRKTANLTPEANEIGLHDRAFFIPTNPGKLIRFPCCGNFGTADYSEDPRQRCPSCGKAWTRKKDWATMYAESLVNNSLHGSWRKEHQEILRETDVPSFITKAGDVKPITKSEYTFAGIQHKLSERGLKQNLHAGKRNVQRLRSGSVSKALGSAPNVRKLP